MDWWLIPIGLAVLALLRYLWVAAFNGRDTVSAMPELDGYVPGERGGVEPPRETASDPQREVDDGGTWIEIDIEPLFASSESRQIVEVTEDPEVTP